MGTRGFLGFAVDGEEKIAYNQFDSYPDGLGLAVLQWLREAALAPARLRRRVREIRLVTQADPPRPIDIAQLKRWHDPAVSTGDTKEWYSLLRGTQGDPEAILEAGVIEGHASWPLDSLFCEWGYLVDLDGDGWFEVYRGFQVLPHKRGRFADRLEKPDPTYDGQGYWPVALVARWRIGLLPSDEDFLEALKEEDEDA